MTACPCGSGVELAACCGPFLTGAAPPETAEALMRSRYSAHVLGTVDYLKETLWPAYQKRFDPRATAAFANDTAWIGLTIIETEAGGAADRRGIVLFEARFLAGDRVEVHRERSLFRKKAGRWYYLEALPETPDA